MNFDDFVNIVYGKNVFEDENSHYIREHIFPYLLPLLALINNEKEKHKNSDVFYGCEEKEPQLTILYGEKTNRYPPRINIEILGSTKLHEKKQNLSFIFIFFVLHL
ncbi:conserved Plasmodium protein, unknown function [Plasmodium gonderi]|uniref:Uncharacterized protein n=1 Tax=Plasmodium gonderi TaxID=77519 RepID=A0A1Y1JPE9_PLAGO|nr:conserved Plasmodium protein, unknown function [Plasmodium gonderi]GAW82283.1 conserved Plasmodium protein, unknown function [Plasmodium gonderi]